ncbi:polysaccharide biosynthesis protein GumN [Paenibacillus selenitireducens]|uniref:Polysaccharide biosynthesis protein GumN n=1 Tax=Paenibacillus selenitireducens TaxID=1324314 RepID=A0A1T2X6Z7_9BACL|nr:TraB/GumN family protein [Paenibacillus selenitireducens]OPA75612.1 polysaccharide biosynthesis protein GumN [Paenibacillus selenitireducens]
MKNWKKSLLALMISAGMLMAAAPAMAAPQTPALKVNDENIGFASSAPIIDQGVTMVPLRSTLQALNVKLTDVKDGTIHAVAGDRKITLSSKTKLINGVTYVPVRTVGEAAGYEVYWDQSTRTVLLLSKTTQAGARGFMWEVKHSGNTVYLVGSMHIADDSFYPLRAEFEQAFAEADYLGVEIDLSKAADKEQQQLIMNIGMYQDGTTLKDHVSKETYAKVEEILKKNGMKPDALDAFKPWVAETTLGSLKAIKAGYEATEGIDLYFIQKAMERKIPVLELESYESQLSMFDHFSKELQEKNLNAALDNFDVLNDTVDNMADMWKQGDDKALLELTNSMAGDAEYNKAMLIDRNIGMADKIDGYLKSDKKAEYFIVVGAAHYLGEHGVIKLLEDKGYTVERK